MKTFITLIFLLSLTYCFSQDDYKVIEVSGSKNVFLFFPSPITKGIPGSSNYTFKYNKQKAENFGVLKGQKGPESNLHIFTKDGSVYSFVLRYNPNIKKFNYFFKKQDALGRMKPEGSTGEDKQEKNEQENIGEKIVESSYHENKSDELSIDYKYCQDLIERGNYFRGRTFLGEK